MQFHLNGYRTGDPLVEDEHPSVAERPPGLPDEVDVLIVGCGPAGLVLAAQMANFPHIRTAVIDRRDGPLDVGQADGVACRTVEMFEAFGLAEKMIGEAYWVNETHFWGADPQDNARIIRLGRTQDVRDLLSEFPHVIVNQARLLDFFLEHMAHSPSRLRVDYGHEALTADVPKAADEPVTVTVRRGSAGGEGEEITVRAKYVVGCDGAHSRVRHELGLAFEGAALPARLAAGRRRPGPGRPQQRGAHVLPSERTAAGLRADGWSPVARRHAQRGRPRREASVVRGDPGAHRPAGTAAHHGLRSGVAVVLPVPAAMGRQACRRVVPQS